ncbi:acyltransferase family protein [Roseobacter sp. A03A-229]
MKYRPEIDGLRSIAVLPVILFHGGLALFSGGFVGVDVFFVISGYLITTIIAGNLDEGRFSLLDFYSRRARRILPALVLVVACTIPFAWAWMLPTDFKDFGQSVSAVSLFSSNFLFWLESDYFAAAAERKPLLHTWSLAVEEQYYIFFPLLLMAFWRRAARGTVGLLCVIFLASLAASEVLWRIAPDANFYLLPSRIWELMAGSLVAIWMLRRGPLPSNIGAAIGLGLILASIFLYDKTTPFPSLYALAPVMGTVLVILCGVQGTWVARILSLRAPVAIGLISYSAYLWHQPLFALARIRLGHPDIAIMMSLAGLSLVLAWISWRFVEQPFRTMPGRAWKVVSGTAVGSLAVFALGVGLGYSGLQERYFVASLSPQNQVLLTRINRMQTMNHYVAKDAGDCRFFVTDYGADLDARFAACAATHGPALVVFGDSHAIDVYKALVANWDRPFLVGLPQKACRPHIEDAPCLPSELSTFFETHEDQIAHAVYVQAGFWLFTDADGVRRDRRLFADGGEIDAQLYTAAIDRALDVLQAFDAEVPVTWLGPRIEPHVSMETMLGIECDVAADNLSLRPAHRAAFDALDAHLARATAAVGLGYISEIEAVQFDISQELFNCEALYWSDGDHWGPAGEKLFGARLAPAFQALEATDQATN